MAETFHIAPLPPGLTPEPDRCRVAPPSPATLRREEPGETWLAYDGDDAVAACASLWWRDTPRLDRRRCGYIGHYRAADRQAAQALLKHACGRLRSQGCEVAVGPANGSTWRDYRLVTGGADHPAFFLEPRNPPVWVRDMTDAGFSVVATYHSRLTTRLDYKDPALQDIKWRLSKSGVRLRGLDHARLKDDLRAIYDLTHDCFSDNFLYSRIPFGSFEAMYAGLAAGDGAQHVVLAEQAGRLVGFVFAIPDYAGQDTDTRPSALILKTLAVRRMRALAGLGRVLIHEINRHARVCGYRAVIHALMHDANVSAAYSRRFADVIRRYALFAKVLA